MAAKTIDEYVDNVPLEPGARQLASVKVASLDEIDEIAFAAWLEQAAKLDA